MPVKHFNRSQSFVLCDQSEEFMRKNPGLKKQISVVSVELHDKTDEKRYRCPYLKVFGVTADGDRLLLWDRTNNEKSIYRQYGSHYQPPLSLRFAISLG